MAHTERLRALVDKHGIELAAKLLEVEQKTLRESLRGPRCKISLLRVVRAERKHTGE